MRVVDVFVVLGRIGRSPVTITILTTLVLVLIVIFAFARDPLGPTIELQSARRADRLKEDLDISGSEVISHAEITLPEVPAEEASRLPARLQMDMSADGTPLRLSSTDFRPVPVEYSTALVVLTHDRFDYLRRTLEHLLKARNVDKYTIMISIDREGLLDSAKAAVKSVPNPKNVKLNFLMSELPFAERRYNRDPSITRHMAKVMHQVFNLDMFEYVIFLEDDLEVSFDFFDYFASVGQLLHPYHRTARNLWCVSAWNDNGFPHLDLDPSRVHRTDWYPGLGVLFHKSMWVGRMEFEWPVWDSVEWGYDHWLRHHSTITKTNDCLAPELPRTHHFSTRGMHVTADRADFYDSMALSAGDTPVGIAHVETAMKAGSMRQYYLRLLNNAMEIDLDQLLNTELKDKTVVLYFDDEHGSRDPSTARKVLTKFELYPDSFRMRFRGLLTFKVKDKGLRVILVAKSMREYWSKQF
jgi:hypothetical protein